MKRNARKDRAEDRVQRYKTGGGTYTPKVTEESAKILEMMSGQMEPDENPYDCDEEYLGNYKISL